MYLTITCFLKTFDLDWFIAEKDLHRNFPKQKSVQISHLDGLDWLWARIKSMLALHEENF